jgi:hypothetical protein
MKIIGIYFASLILSQFLLSSFLKSQPIDPNGWVQCEYNITPLIEKNTLLPGGLYKPERTNKYPGTNQNSFFRVLVVYVQFKDDYTYADDINWPAQQPPIYIDSLFANVKNNSYGNEWWNAYNENTEIISDYYLEISRGNFHVLGQSVNIILENDSTHYQYIGGLNELNSEIYSTLYKNPNILWSEFDKWSYDNINHTFVYGSNDYLIDMIYVVHRVWRNNIKQDDELPLTEGSIARLYESTQGNNHLLLNGYSIRAGMSAYGSGITFTTGQQQKEPQRPFSKNRLITTQGHEFGHYFGFDHRNYGLMMGGPSIAVITGPDARFSPWESSKLGYGNFLDVQLNQLNHLNDFSSRDNNDNIFQTLRIPISVGNNNEYFLLALRNKISKYDRIMLGDTARGDPYRIIKNEYGKGLYIYHFNDDETYGLKGEDLECADGLFNWEIESGFTPEWCGNQTLPFYSPVIVRRDANDPSYGDILQADGKSVFGYYNNIQYNNWGSIGKKESGCGYEGTDKSLVNVREKYTSRAYLGDRWDSWSLTNNNLFSPYSSPSTRNWNHETTNYFIYIVNENNEGIDFYVYKPDINLTESDILFLTPPTKPMGIKLIEHYPEMDSPFCRPKIIWEHNIEPDMFDINTGKKRYIIYKATEVDMNNVPNNFQQYGPPKDYLPNEEPSFIDYGVKEFDCSIFDQPPYGTPYPIRYKVKAVDNTGKTSVYSDFVATEGITDNGSKEPPSNDNALMLKDLKFSISQNYPNPFNPLTRFKYTLPTDGNVSIIVYDITGREISNLENNFKKAGVYIIDFNAVNISSGVYFYRIKYGNNIITKKMILLK